MQNAQHHEWLWCDDRAIINEWFSMQDKYDYLQFYASFINWTNMTWERARQTSAPPLNELQQFVLSILHEQPIPAEKLLRALEGYMDQLDHGRLKTKGPIGFWGGLDLAKVKAGTTKFHNKIFASKRKTERRAKVPELTEDRKNGVDAARNFVNTAPSSSILASLTGTGRQPPGLAELSSVGRALPDTDSSLPAPSVQQQPLPDFNELVHRRMQGN